MAIELKMPALSPTMEEGTLAKWLVKEGDSVAAGDILAEIETDKATMEFEAVDEGVVIKILVPEGTDGVKVGTPIALIGAEGEEAAAPAAEEKAASAPVAKTEAPAPAPPTAAPVETPPASAQPAAPLKADSERIKASPLARKLAQAQGIDLATLTGSGPGGRIVRADLGSAAGGAPAQPQAAPAPAAARHARPARRRHRPRARTALRHPRHGALHPPPQLQHNNHTELQHEQPPLQLQLRQLPQPRRLLHLRSVPRRVRGRSTH